MLEILYEAAQIAADTYENGRIDPLVNKNLVFIANQCESARSEYASIRRYLDEDKPPASLDIRADGLNSA